MQPAGEEEEAFQQYMEKFGESRDGTSAGKQVQEQDIDAIHSRRLSNLPGFNRKAFPWFTPKEPVKVQNVSTEVRVRAVRRIRTASFACEVLEAAMDFKPKPRTSSSKLCEVDSEARLDCK